MDFSKRLSLLNASVFSSVVLALSLLVSVTACELYRKPSQPVAKRPSVPVRKPAPSAPLKPKPTVVAASPKPVPATAPAYQRPRDFSPKYHSAEPGSPTSNLIATARSYLESPYTTAGNTSAGLDCSGFTCVCFKQVGVVLPRIARQQALTGEAVPLDQLQPGDLVFFSIDQKSRGTIDHTGIVTEVRGPQEVMFIHSSSSQGVREANLYLPYWQKAYAWARRVAY